MRRITDSLLKSIVRQSLNESYGLLNEDLQEVTPYDITTNSKHGTVPKGAIVTGMTYEPCPEGGICFEYLENAKIYKDSKSAKELINTYCGKTYMGKQTLEGTALSNVTQNLFAQLTEFGMNTNDIVNGLTNLADFPTFCAANTKFKKLNGGAYPLGIPGTSETTGSDYGIENAYEGPRNKFYGIIEGLFENSIAVSDEYYGVWKKQLEDKYKITQDAANKKKNDDENKKKNDADLKVKLTGGGSWDDQGWITKHPALGKNETITTNEGNSSVYSLLTNNPNIDKYLYGIMVKNDDATIQPVKFLKTDKTLPLLIDAATEQWVKWSISQSDIWKYDDVVVIDGNIALTTDPGREKKFATNESYRHKGFRHNLLTEADLTIGSKGAEVESIQKKLGVLPVTKVFDEKTKAAVIEFQTNMGIVPVTGIVDNKTLKKINDYSVTVTPANSFKSLSIANKSKGDDVKLIQQKLGIPVDGGFGTDTETAVIDFQTKYRNDLPNAVAGVVDIDTFNLIKKYTANDAGINKVYSGVKTTYSANDWIYVNPKLGSEGDLLAEKKYFKIKRVLEDRYTVVLDSPTNETFDVSNVGGITAKILFGRDAETGSQTGPNNTNDSGNKEKGKRNKVDNSGKSNNSGTNTVDPEKQRKRELRLNETCKTLREIKQYLNNTKGLSMVVNCKWNQEIRNQVMIALTGGTPVPVEQPANNVVTSVPVTDRLF
jgi:peptidoglycan hydrolase-like protein with peptidoglycan-binding domain